MHAARVAKDIARHKNDMEQKKRAEKKRKKEEKRQKKEADKKGIDMSELKNGQSIDASDDVDLSPTDNDQYYYQGEDEDGNRIRKPPRMGRILSKDVHKDPDYNRRVQDYTAAFQGMDNDGDGTITFEEFKSLWVKSGFLSNEGDIKVLFNQVDVNGDGTISLKEFIELNERYAMPSTEEEIREAFKVFDKDNDGFITSDELKRILTKMGEPMTEEEAEEIIGYVDKNGDGKVDIDEFIVMMLKCIADEEELDTEDD